VDYRELDTPALLIDKEKLLDNIRYMQSYANKNLVTLRPHAKTHKMPYIAKLQEEYGAKGIAVAKVGEAEVMAANGLKDIFIANEIVGMPKLMRIRELAKSIDISFGVDSIPQIDMVEEAFEGAEKKAQVLIEIEVGENRSGVVEEKDFIDLVKHIKACRNINLKGIFSHEGHCYSARDVEHCRELFMESQKRTLRFAEIAENLGCKLDTVSIGSTPSSMFDFEIMEGITELRVGTYVFMDASQGNAIGTYDRCAATVLTTVISRPTEERVITDVGAKGITMQTRNKGICATKGLGVIKGYNDVYVHAVYDEYAIIYSKELRDSVKVGDKLEIIPNHICPVCNLYDTAYLISQGEVIMEIPVSCRGKLR